MDYSAIATLHSHVSSNIRKTWLLIAMFLILVIFLGWVFSVAMGEPIILYIAVGVSLVMNVIAYWKSDKIALSLSGAKPITRYDHRTFYRTVENLSIASGLPMPRLYIIHAPQINAFATGRDPQHAAIAVTTGALKELNDNELEGVLSHELSHIKNRDILVSSVAVVLAGVVALMADWFMRMMFWGSFGGRDRGQGGAVVMLVGIAAAILTPLFATLIRLAVSRKREYLADASGALLTRYPVGLASALEKIAHDAGTMRRASNATAHLFIANPFKGKQKRSFFAKLFATHPPVEERVKVLRSMRMHK